mgnify:CR=1 FL=1
MVFHVGHRHVRGVGKAQHHHAQCHQAVVHQLIAHLRADKLGPAQRDLGILRIVGDASITARAQRTC